MSERLTRVVLVKGRGRGQPGGRLGVFDWHQDRGWRFTPHTSRAADRAVRAWTGIPEDLDPGPYFGALNPAHVDKREHQPDRFDVPGLSVRWEKLAPVLDALADTLPGPSQTLTVCELRLCVDRSKR